MSPNCRPGGHAVSTPVHGHPYEADGGHFCVEEHAVDSCSYAPALDNFCCSVSLAHGLIMNTPTPTRRRAPLHPTAGSQKQQTHATAGQTRNEGEDGTQPGLAEGLVHATWRGPLQALGACSLDEHLVTTVATQRHIPKALYGAFRRCRLEIGSTGGRRDTPGVFAEMLAAGATATSATAPGRRQRASEKLSLYNAFKSGDRQLLLQVERCFLARQIPREETPDVNASTAIGALASENLTKASTQLVSFGVAPTTDASLNCVGDATTPNWPANIQHKQSDQRALTTREVPPNTCASRAGSRPKTLQAGPQNP